MDLIISARELNLICSRQLNEQTIDWLLVVASIVSYGALGYVPLEIAYEPDGNFAREGMGTVA